MRNLKFGIEMEVATSKSRVEIANALREAGIKIKETSYGAPVEQNAWKIHRDGSLGKGWEIVSPPLTSLDEVEIVTNVLRKVLKVRCTSKCGLHIHHDVSDFNLEQLKNIYRLYCKYEGNAIASIQSPTRKNNRYCGRTSLFLDDVLRSGSIVEFKRAVPTRYLTVNSHSYVKYGTIEFRGAQGTVDINRIRAWVELTHKIVETASTMVKEVPLVHNSNELRLEELFEELDLSERTRKHYRSVQRYFAKIA